MVPLGYEAGGHPSAAHRILRRTAVRGVQRELRRAGERARDVLVVQPHPDDLDVYGTNFLRGTDNARVADRARQRTHDSLRLPEVADFVAGLAVRAAV